MGLPMLPPRAHLWRCKWCPESASASQPMVPIKFELPRLAALALLLVLSACVPAAAQMER